MSEGLILSLFLRRRTTRYSTKTRQLDLSYSFEDKARFRVNAYFQRGFIAAALRLIPASNQNRRRAGAPARPPRLCQIKSGFCFYSLVRPATANQRPSPLLLMKSITSAPTTLLPLKTRLNIFLFRPGHYFSTRIGL